MHFYRAKEAVKLTNMRYAPHVLGSILGCTRVHFRVLLLLHECKFHVNQQTFNIKTSLTYDWVSRGLDCWVKVVLTNGVRPCPHLLCALCPRWLQWSWRELCTKHILLELQMCGEKMDQTKRVKFKTFTVGCCRHETCRKPPNRSTREMGVASCKPSSSSSPNS